MNTPLFEQNIRLLRQRDPTLADRLEAGTSTGTWKLFPSKKGPLTASFRRAKGNEVHIHSLYDPVREAEQLAKNYKYTPTADLVFLGFGLGYHVREVLRRKGKHGVILITEPNLELLRAAFAEIDYSEILQLPAVIWSVNEPGPRLFSRLKQHSLSILANGVTLLEHPPSEKLHPVYYASVKKIISDIYSWSKVNVNTQVAKAEDFASNVLANMIEMIKNPGVSHLAGAYANRPAFIVSAGPSLDKNVHYLREVGNKGLIIAVDSALKTLLDKDIRPDLVVSIDFSEHNLRYLENIKSKDLVLVFDPEVHPLIPQRFNGRKFVMDIPGKSLCEWFRARIKDNGAIEKGLSVSHSAFLLTLHMQANPIIFVGQDLSYPRGAWHSKGSYNYQRADIHAVMQKRLGKVEGYFGGAIVTDAALKVFLSHFESMIESLAVQCFNATEGGARIKGVRPITLKDAIMRFCSEPLDKSIIWQATFDIDVEGYIQELYTAGLTIVDKLTRCNHNAYKAFQYIEAMLEQSNQPVFNAGAMMSLFKKVVALIKEFSHDEEVLSVIKDNAIEALLIRSQRDLKSLGEDTLENKEDLQRILQRERLFFTTLIKASDFVCQQFCSLLNRIQANYPVETVSA